MPLNIYDLVDCHLYPSPGLHEVLRKVKKYITRFSRPLKMTLSDLRKTINKYLWWNYFSSDIAVSAISSDDLVPFNCDQVRIQNMNWIIS